MRVGTKPAASVSRECVRDIAVLALILVMGAGLRAAYLREWARGAEARAAR